MKNATSGEVSIFSQDSESKVVVKRDGRKEPFNHEKLKSSIWKASSGVELLREEEINQIYEQVLRDLSLSDHEVKSTHISDLVEKNMINLMVENQGWEEAAKRYVLGRIYNHVYGKGNWNTFSNEDLMLSFNALKVLEARYLLKHHETLRYIETPSMMFKRVASFIASVEIDEESRRQYREKFYHLMSGLRFIPNSPTLMNAGTRNGVLSACYVIPVRDSLTTTEGDGIMDSLRAQALIQQQGGGTGFDFSELRPEGDIVKSTQGIASGPLSFMRLFDTTTEVIKQGGKRRGANMGVLHVFHPDIRKFIKAKTGELKDVILQNFNISVGVYDSFMKAVEEDSLFPLINPRKTWLRNTVELSSKYYATRLMRFSIEEKWVQEEIYRELEENDWSLPLQNSSIITWEEALAIAENENGITGWIRAKELFDEIVNSAWDSGDPGMLFIDTINRTHPIWYLGKINATNPCGEEPLLDWENCNLGSINLTKYVIEKDDRLIVDWDKLGEDVKTAVRFLDNVIDANKHPLPQITEANRLTRKIGLGVMGWAHFLAMLEIPYDSVEAVFLAYKISEWIAYNAYSESIMLAKEKGSFPAFDPKRYRPIWRNAARIEELLGKAGFKLPESLPVDVPHPDWRLVDELYMKYGIRNATVTSIAPTGTISIIGGTSSSIEPLFALAFMRIVSVGTFIEIDKVFLRALDNTNASSKELIERIAETGSIQGIEGIDRKLKEIFKTAHDIDPIWHLLHQAAWQAWVDAGTSKTINLRESEPPDTVRRVYMLAWKLGIKGITVYRDKSKKIQVLNKGLSVKSAARQDEAIKKKIEEVREVKQTAKKLRIGKKDMVVAEEDYAGGCPTCET
ncbi:MAG: ribonucleoside-diphosphate reductase, adenosylcobalamin-dependent [Fervidicoccus sp.]|nr:MAG: ribonucleoside-diphosphate reductase, adenosylcobalamin-dependent [Fervidicoccus sp.]